MTGLGTDACTVTLTAAAPSGGLAVSLSSSSSAVTVPGSVTVPANATSVGFTANVSAVAAAQTVTLSASASGTSKTFALQLNPATITLSINATSVAFGNVATNTSATQSVTLTSTGTQPVTISAATLAGAGFTLSGPAFPATLNPGQAATLNIQFLPTAAGPMTGQLSIVSNSVTNGTASIAVSGTGVAPSSAIAVAVTPTAASAITGTTQQFVASVTGTSNTAVTWTVSGTGCSGATCGTISSSGLYTAPATAPATATVTITATSAADSTKSATAKVAIVPPASIPTTGTVYYLSPSGKDSNSGLSSSSPWLTPNHSVNCGDTIIAAASSSYSPTNFSMGNWGTVTCPAGNNVAWLTCAAFDACKISSTSSQSPAMWVDHSYWGVQGWEVSSTSQECFLARPNTSNPVVIHHIIFANDIANGCFQGGFSIVNSSKVGVDYVAVVGSIAYNAAQGSASCTSGISIYQPVQSDSQPGTHIYVAGNFAYKNVEPSQCAGGTPTDGEGIILDTFDGSQGSMPAPYAAQAVAENNVLLANGSSGLEVFNNSAGSSHATIYMRNNTSWGNLTDSNLSSTSCGDIQISRASNTQAYNNLIAMTSATGCGGHPIYAISLTSGNATDQLYSNFAYGLNNQNTLLSNNGTFALGANNVLGVDPAYSNPVVPAAPNCAAASNVPSCMAPVIANFTPKNPLALASGYQIPSGTSAYDPLFPQWLCNVNLPAGLVTMGCQ